MGQVNFGVCIRICFWRLKPLPHLVGFGQCKLTMAFIIKALEIPTHKVCIDADENGISNLTQEKDTTGYEPYLFFVWASPQFWLVPC